jgi:hypothetical protein
MKYFKYIMLALLMAGSTTEACAKKMKTDHMYMFGFSASFKDSTIYITDIQDVQGAWYDTRTKFLMGRDNYSYQLKEYMANQQQQPNRVCMVFFSTSKKKAEKQYLKIKKKYVEKAPGVYAVRYLNVSDFKFEAVDMSPE